MTTIKPMLAESVGGTSPTPDSIARHVDKLLGDNDWCLEQKLDGMRLLVRVQDGHVEFLQRQGKPTSKMTPGKVRSVFQRITSGLWYFDGELVIPDGGNAMDAVFWLFDMPIALDKVDLSTPLEDRKAMLDGVYDGLLLGHTEQLRLLPTVYEEADKRELLDKVKANGGEGVMFKHLDGVYASGRRSRHLLKAKNWYDADCIVTRTRIGGKDNMELAVHRNGVLTIIGECTALAGDGARIQPGDVVCVKYLYLGAGGRLYQPTFPKIRTDKTAAECTYDQLVAVNKEVFA